MKTDYAEFKSDKYIMEKWFPNFTGTMVEVGAGLPEYISMSKFFRKKGWRTICIEPNPRYVQMYKDLGYEIYEYALSDKNEKDIDFEIYIEEKSFNEGVDGPFQGLSVSSLKARQHVEKCYTKHVIKVEVVTLNWLLESLNIKKIDFVSVDTEGWELEVMKGFDAYKYDVKVIMLENFNHSVLYHTYMSELGYKLEDKIEYNYIYVKK